jgi:selenocysteine lyase/cysteine desulfurase
MPIDLDAFRNEFPLLRTKTYLNSCSYAVLSNAVERAFLEYLQSRQSNGSDWERWVGRLETLRGHLGTLLDCAPADVSISTSLSESVNALASSLDFAGKRKAIVVTDFDFPTTSQIWLAQEKRGAQVLRARADASGVQIPLQHFDALIDENTLLVSLPLVCYRNGVRLDIGPVIDLAHERGALVLVDAYQGLGTMPLSAPNIGADFLAGGCLKYLLGTAGIGFMYVRESESRAETPTTTGWFAQENIFAMDIYHNSPARNARRFESGTPNVSATYACAAGLELLLNLGLEVAQKQIRHLTGRIAEKASERGWPLVTPADPDRHGAMMAIASSDAPALVRELAADGIVVSDRDGNVRLSPHAYNNDEDLEVLFHALERKENMLASP